MSELFYKKSIFLYRKSNKRLGNDSTIVVGYAPKLGGAVNVRHLSGREVIRDIIIPYRLYAYGFRVKGLK